MNLAKEIQTVVPIVALFGLLGVRLYSKKIGWASASGWLVLPTLALLMAPVNPLGLLSEVCLIMDLLLALTIANEQESRSLLFGSRTSVRRTTSMHIFSSYDWQPMKRKTEDEEPSYLGPKPPLT